MAIDEQKGADVKAKEVLRKNRRMGLKMEKARWQYEGYCRIYSDTPVNGPMNMDKSTHRAVNTLSDG